MSLEDVVNSVVSAKPAPISDRSSVETEAFKQAILLQPVELGRTPSYVQVEKAWERWKRERGLDANAEKNLDLEKLHK